PGDVVVIHDILSDVFQSYSGSLAVLLRKRQLKHCSKIIAASQFIKKDLLKLHINPEKIEVIYNGVDHNLFYPRTADSLVDQSEDIAYIQPFAIKRPYIIYASRLSKPEKKHAELIKAFSLFKKNTGLPHKLVLAGNENPYAEHIHRLVSASAYSSDILITGHFPHENFFDLYAFSDACVFPSVREGVGLPVIEAMASGIPVACADAGSLREIAGDFALYFNPDDIESFAKAIEQIIIDKKLRQTLVKGGIDRTKRFSWEKTAQKTVDLLKSL
ncbi:MAG: glycosyltransferase family 1 protein, partial [Spirochaetales bacterium]